MMDSIIKLVIGDLDEKRAYKRLQARVKALPEDYRFVYERIQKYMWIFAPDGFDTTGLLELFEGGAADGKHVLDVTGRDVAAFCDGLVAEADGKKESLHDKTNREVREWFEKEGRRP